eukprot:TRINITY_DN3340_c0_g1_i2.p1 TRINITY_DN3340_c0_g1~~TRINITY_DN3340_c0_g1_i2.p1  ORF type:complete len:123 (-),score=21.22 TRINITY_DN3340_c0_g1_i2:37-405(-)
MGSFSKMARVEDPNNTHELYGSDLSLGRIFWYRRFHTAMVWFLECIQELGEYAHSVDPSFNLKYKIQQDRIGDLSIRLTFNQEENWTKSLKYMLTNLKYLLVWTAVHFGSSTPANLDNEHKS